MQKLALNITTILALSVNLVGCSWEEEKTYEYYAVHPEELYHDYHYCETHPSANICLNIIKKYYKYQKNAQAGATSLSTGAIFRNIDEPIDSLH